MSSLVGPADDAWEDRSGAKHEGSAQRRARGVAEMAKNHKAFKVGDAVRYTPGFGTYGYEETVGPDGTVPGIVAGHSATRVRVRMMSDRGLVVRAVAATSLKLVPELPRA